MPASYDDETILGLKRTIRELSLNQTRHFIMIQNYSRSMEDFRAQVVVITADVSSIKDSLKEAPQMLNIGKELDSLKSSLATFGATISDMKLSLSELKESPLSSSSLSESLTAINSTLHDRLDFVMTDLHSHHVCHHIVSSIANVNFLFKKSGYHHYTPKYHGTPLCSEPVQPSTEGRCCPIGTR